ncbi:hypothetical protein DQ04_01341110 [Trypanosoma grayi]|uniref:hypothetical protein n=1 Tax=Trypanosoma grayi TaxID=71804 RepID=UPI0004F41292|nr:hypothetical protein DQ04_01341110 [Trypanosoma grayi]KEG12909.1 hypothetical protein DQ04_01341110 [Trypanosoma grayi]
MYSPCEAVYGYDRTHIKRMTPLEYMREKDTPAARYSAREGDGGGLLRSRDPNVQFYSKYPVYDRSGRELCVLYQMLEMEVQQELRRVERGGDATRISGVRLSAEITLDDTPDEALRVPQQEQPQPHKQESAGAYYLNHFVPAPLVGEDDDVDVSASTHRISSMMVPSPNYVGAVAQAPRASSFSIYRESGLNPCMKLPEPQEGNQQHQQQRSDVISDGSHSTFVSQRLLRGDGNAHTFYPPPPPQRSSTASPKRLGDIDGETDNDNEEDNENVYTTEVGLETTSGPEQLRFTTVRPSELRTTKQLFVPGRTTTTRRTIKHASPIPSQVYGIHSQTIPAALVAPLVSANLEAICCSSDFWSIDELTPQLRPGITVTLCGDRYHVLRYHDSSDVYEAYTETETQLNASEQVLLYRWSVRAVQHGVNEAHRAALGLSLTSSALRVAGYRYRDGGLTAITLPMGYRAVPLSTVPLSAGSFPTCVKLLLRMLSDLVVKRTIHGNLRAMNHIFLALRRGDVGVDMPAAVLVPVHWERLVDFSMFVDRNAGRTIPMSHDDDGSRKGERVFHGQDVSTVVTMLLENELAEHLRPDQLAEAQRLMMLTTEPTQVANYLIQLKNTMTAIPSDMASLQQDYEVSLQSFC